jgi:hypothetical protein
VRARLEALGRLIGSLPWDWLVLGLGIWLRLTFWTDHAHKSFDFTDHRLYIEWFQAHLELPPLDYSRSAYGPPLFYLLGGLLMRAGFDLQGVHHFAILLGILRLCFFALILRAWPGISRSTRTIALLLAAVLPAAIHIDGMLNNESLSMLLCWAAVAFFRPLAISSGRRQLAIAAAVGGLIGLAFLTKFSALMLVLTTVGLGVLAALFTAGGFGDRWREARPYLLAALIAVSLSGWCYVRNVQRYGQPFPTTFEAEDARMMAHAKDLPIWERRPLDFYYGWSPALLEVPHQPSAAGHFWPNLVGATFSDYYLHRFSPVVPAGPTGARFAEPVLSLARLSVASGFLVGLITAVSFGWLLLGALRRRDLAVIGALTVAALAIAGQLFFSIKYPVDAYGVTKGTYLQFGAAPLFVLYGLAFTWSWRRPWRWPLGLLMSGTLLAITAYSVVSRWLEPLAG